MYCSTNNLPAEFDSREEDLQVIQQSIFWGDFKVITQGQGTQIDQDGVVGPGMLWHNDNGSTDANVHLNAHCISVCRLRENQNTN